MPRGGVSALVHVSGDQLVLRAHRGKEVLDIRCESRDIDINVILDEYCCIML